MCCENVHCPNYLGDLIRQETGESAIRFINKYIVRKAKSMLVEGNSIASTAYALGFNYPAPQAGS